MWLVTTLGFFSVVKWKGEDCLTIRARVKTDLERLRDRYAPGLGPIEEFAGTDYEYRAKISKKEFAGAMVEIIIDLDYDNFKSAVAREPGESRCGIYHRIWDVLRDLSPNTKDYFWEKKGGFLSDWPFHITVEEEAEDIEETENPWEEWEEWEESPPCVAGIKASALTLDYKTKRKRG